MTDTSQLSDADLLRIASGQSLPGVQTAPLPPLPGANSYGSPTAGPGYNAGVDFNKLSDGQLLAYLADTNPKMGTLEDVGRSAIAGGELSAGGMANGPSGIADSVRSIGQAGIDLLARHGIGNGHDQLGGQPALPGPAQMIPGMLAAAAQRFGVDPNLAKTYASAGNPLFALNGPTPEQGAVALNGGLPLHVPQTTPGRYAERATEFAPGALMPGGLIRKAANVVLPGLGSQGAQDVAPDELKPAAGLAGAVLGGGLAMAGSRVAESPQAALGRALGNVTPDQMQQAQALRERAASLHNIDLTLAEAVQHVTNNGTGLGRLQRVIEGTRQGQARTGPYFAQRPGQVQAAGEAMADAIAPRSLQPSMIGVRAQDTATTALDNARQVVNLAAKPAYDALEQQTMDPARYAELAADPSYRIALEQLRAHPELGATVANLPDNNLSVINEVQKRLDTGAQQARGTPLMPGDNHLAALRTGARSLADELSREQSPEYGRARDTVRELSGEYVDPLRAGPLGKISGTSDVHAQTEALYPRKPLEGAANETTQAVRFLGLTKPGVAEDLTRQHLANALESSVSNLQSGQNQYAGAKYAVRLAGSPEQAEVLRAGVGSLPDGLLKRQMLDDLVEAMQATGKRQPPGSMTAFNASDLNDLHITPFAHAIGRIGDPLTWGAGLGDLLNKANYSRNVNSLADMLMSHPFDTAETLARAKAAANRGPDSLLPVVLQDQTGTRH